MLVQQDAPCEPSPGLHVCVVPCSTPLLLTSSPHPLPVGGAALGPQLGQATAATPSQARRQGLECCAERRGAARRPRRASASLKAVGEGGRTARMARGWQLLARTGHTSSGGAPNGATQRACSVSEMRAWTGGVPGVTPVPLTHSVHVTPLSAHLGQCPYVPASGAVFASLHGLSHSVVAVHSVSGPVT